MFEKTKESPVTFVCCKLFPISKCCGNCLFTFYRFLGGESSALEADLFVLSHLQPRVDSYPNSKEAVINTRMLTMDITNTVCECGDWSKVLRTQIAWCYLGFIFHELGHISIEACVDQHALRPCSTLGTRPA
jgi:hypothetical protein